MQVAIIGITGYAGSTLYELLKKHSQVNQINLYGHNLSKPTQLNQINDEFSYDQHLVFPYDENAIIKDNDAVFFATPAGVTSKMAKPFIKAGFPVIDLSGDYRLKDPDEYVKWYQKEPAELSDLQKAQYCLADIDDSEGAKYIANPGCYATAVLLGLAPVVKEDLIDLDSIVIDAKSGLSGAGKSLSDSSHFVMANENLQVYKPHEHKHIPEIVQKLQVWNKNVQNIEFMTTLVPLNKGIMCTMFMKLKSNIEMDKVQHAFDSLYANSKFVHVSMDELPTIKSVVGTNECHVGLSFNSSNNSLMIVSVIDNMIKGAAGQAIQNFNHLFDFEETDGLELMHELP